jgi:formylglycine-generating enzyme required for sulfatase activity
MKQLTCICFRCLVIGLAFQFFIAISWAASPVVSNLTAAQRAGTKLVDINYDLNPSGLKALAMSLQISSDGGATWTVPVTNVGGDIGNVDSGAGKSIVWNAGIDWPAGYTDRMRFKVMADDTSSLVLIPGGKFVMGRTSGDKDEDAPPVNVTLDAFYIQKTEVTQAQWAEVRVWGLVNGYNDLPLRNNEGYPSKGAMHPVHSVSWHDAVKWCNARSEKEGLQPCYRISGSVLKIGGGSPDVNWQATGYRLPTEAEWEKAARGGISGKRFPSGAETISHAQANYYGLGGELLISYDLSPINNYNPVYATGGHPYTSPVASFGANGYGLYDMSGNLGEWCWDWHGVYTNGLINPKGDITGWTRIVRGGSYQEFAADCRAASRLSYNADRRSIILGFRPVRGFNS